MSTPNKKLGSFIQRLYSLKFPAPKLEMYQGKYNVGRDLHCLEGEGVELQGFEEEGVDRSHLIVHNRLDTRKHR